MTISNIESYLKERVGYLKKGPEALAEILTNQGYVVRVGDCAEALTNIRKEFKGASVSQTETVNYKVENEGSPIDLSKYKPIKVWGKNGNWSASYELITDEEADIVSKLTEKAIDELKDYVDDRPDVFNVNRESKHGTGLAIITDLHIGAQVKHLVNQTKEYSINHVIDYLDTVAEQINAEDYSNVHVGILGDLIESFTGMNHPCSWKELHSEVGHGANVLIIAYQILEAFLSKINNLSNVYIIGGNHDRITSSNKEDDEAGVAKIISHFLNDKLEANVVYDHMIMTVPIEGIDYILTHGHLPMIKKSPEYLILNYGKNRDNFSIILSGHLHNRSKTEQLNVTTVLVDNSKYRALVCPSIFTGNFYSESMGFSTSPGFLMFQSRNGKPRMIDVTL